MGDGKGKGEATTSQLENQIGVLKYVMYFTNALEFLIGASVFGISLWLLMDPDTQDWLGKLDAQDFNIGCYVLVFAAIVVMIVAVLGFCSALRDSNFLLLVYIGVQVVAFIFCLAGAAVLLDNSARDSKLQPRVRESMRVLIMQQHFNEKSREVLALVQQSIGCCGADGPNDFLNLNQPLPPECRDAVTGNPYFYGCVDSLTWFFEQKCSWLSGLTMAVCFLHVINVVVATVLMQAFKKEEDSVYRK